MPSASKIVSAEKCWTTSAEGFCKIRVGHSGIEAIPATSIVDDLHSAAIEFSDHPALVYENGLTVTYSEYEKNIHHLAKAFLKLGLDHRYSVGILARNCPEWFYAHLAAIYAGGIAAGIYTTSSSDSVHHVLQLSRANLVVVEDDQQLQKVLQVRDKLPLLKAIVQMEPLSVERRSGGDVPGLHQWSDLLSMDVSEVEREFEERQAKICVNEAAVLVFTSGTTGMPKGAMLSHDNLLWNANRFRRFGTREKGKDVLIALLPLNHVAGQFDIYLGIKNAATVHFTDPGALKGSSFLEAVLKCRPTIFGATPRLFEKMHERLLKIKKSSLNVKWVEDIALQHHMDNSSGYRRTTWQYLLAQSATLNRLKRAIGLDRCTAILCGSAPMSMELKRYFLQMDLPVMDVFGMTECSGPHIMSDVNAFKLHSVGKTMSGGESRIEQPGQDGQGEVCIRGRHVFMGYIGDEAKTKEALDEDGWLHTGDLGHMDEEGFVYVTARLKEIVITKGGENIPPVHVEHLVKSQLPCVSNAVLVGDQRKYLTMLVTLKTEVDPITARPADELTQETVFWIRKLGVSYSTVSEVIKAGPCPKVLEGITAGILRANRQAMSNAQKVQKFHLLGRDFSVATGELGPTMKIKRHVVLEMYADVIEKMYAEE